MIIFREVARVWKCQIEIFNARFILMLRTLQQGFNPAQKLFHIVLRQIIWTYYYAGWCITLFSQNVWVEDFKKEQFSKFHQFSNFKNRFYQKLFQKPLRDVEIWYERSCWDRCRSLLLLVGIEIWALDFSWYQKKTDRFLLSGQRIMHEDYSSAIGNVRLSSECSQTS